MTMWKNFGFAFFAVTVLSNDLSDSINLNLVERILEKLEKNFNYVDAHHRDINVDCLYGIVFAEAILGDCLNTTLQKREKISILLEKSRDIYKKALPVMNKHQNWQFFAKYVTVPELWKKSINYKQPEFSEAYIKKSKYESFTYISTYKNFSVYEGFTDMCIGEIVNKTLDLQPHICYLSPDCEQFLQEPDKAVGYILTHKLILLQIARARKCKMDTGILNEMIKILCFNMYEELISVEFYGDLDENFDLLLEQIIICSYEGYTDFLKLRWLEKIFDGQHDTGCFPSFISHRKKREANQWVDGCSDHSTGLGAAALSVYVHFILKNE